MKKGKALLALFFSATLASGLNFEEHVANAEETVDYVTGSSATFIIGTSGGFKDWYGTEGANIVSVKITNDTSAIPARADWVKEPIDAGSSSTVKTVVQISDTETKEYNIASFLTKNTTLSTEAQTLYDATVYANVETIYANSNQQMLFHDMNLLESIEFENFNTSNCQSMGMMFYMCHNLKSLDLSSFDTKNLYDMTEMFSNCRSITELDFTKWPNFKTDNVTTMESLFNCCYKLQTLNISTFNMEKNTRLSSFFSGDSSLENLTLPEVMCTSKVRSVISMFYDCQKLKVIDMSTYDMNGVLYDTKIQKYGTWNCVVGCTGLDVFYTPKVLKQLFEFYLPSQFSKYGYPAQATYQNVSQRFSIVPNKFIENWKSLRTSGSTNGICAALYAGSTSRTTLDSLIATYDNMDPLDQAVVDAAWDVEADGVTIKDTIDYVKAVIAKTQGTDGDYGIESANVNTIVNTPVLQTKISLIAIITVASVTAILGYYFYNKKRHAM